jgi:hypothetical protein
MNSVSLDIFLYQIPFYVLNKINPGKNCSSAKTISDVPISNFPLKQEDGTGCLNMKKIVIFVETELEINSIICSSGKNRKLKPLGKSSFLYITRNIQPN